MLTTFFESYKERTANIPHMKTNVHSRERDRRFNIKIDPEKPIRLALIIYYQTTQLVVEEFCQRSANYSHVTIEIC